MKKYALLLLIMFMGYHASSFAQAVDDRAVVPVSVTLNSILRLNVESGGNIEFNFNTLEQYQNGIDGLPNVSGQNEQYSTKITVASSVDWDLEMGAEDDGLVSTDTVGAVASMDLSYIIYEVWYGNAGLTSSDIDVPSSGSPKALSTGTDIITSAAGNAGDVNQNQFTIYWGCGVPNGDASASAGALMGSALTGGRYSTNVFFTLKPAN